MDKQIKDYLHLYLGCYCIVYEDDSLEKFGYAKLTGTVNGNQAIFENFGTSISLTKPILRPLSDMPESDKKFYGNRQGLAYDPLEFIYLLKERYDLFGLIESGLAIDKKKIKL